MANTITIELCAEDRKRLDDILAALQNRETVIETETTVEVVQVEETPIVTRDEVQALVQRLAAPTTGKRDAVRNIVKEYADKVSEIAEDKLAEVMERLNALEV